MVPIIKKIARYSSVFVFFIVFIAGIMSQDINDGTQLAIIMFKACIGAMFFWILGIVICDIALKGLLDAVETGAESKWEGGLVSRFAEEKERVSKPVLEAEEPPAPAKKEAKGAPASGKK